VPERDEQVVPEHLLEKYFDLSGSKFAETIIAAGLAGVFHLCKEVLHGHLKGIDLLRALDFINRKYQLPAITQTDISDSKTIAAWTKRLKAQGHDPTAFLEDLARRKTGTHG
jgi:hypothetical protein